MNPINDRADNAGDENNLPPPPPDEAVVPPRKPRRGHSFWPIEINCDCFSDGALERATRLIEAALRQNAEAEAGEWSGTAEMQDSCARNTALSLQLCQTTFNTGEDQEHTTAPVPGA